MLQRVVHVLDRGAHREVVEAGADGFQQVSTELLGHHERIQPLAEALQLLRVQRVSHRQLQHAHVRLAHDLRDLQGSVARADHAHAVAVPRAPPAVQSVLASVLQSPLQALAHAGVLQVQQSLAQQASFGHMLAAALQTAGRRGLADGLQIHAGGAVSHGGGDAQRCPQAAVARHPRCVRAEAQHVASVRRHEGRQSEIRQDSPGGRGDRRGFRRRVVAHEGHCAARAAGAGHVRVPQCIGRPIQPRRLPVPVADYAVDAILDRRPIRHLRSRNGGDAQLLIDGREVLHIKLAEQRLAAPQLEVVPAQRGALVAGNEAGGLQPNFTVRLRAIQHGAHERLNAG